MSVISVKNVVKTFPSGISQRKEILHGISLKVEQAGVVGFVGLNGAGKSTLINLVMGFTFPDSGTISLLGKNPNNHAARKKIGYLPEHSRFQEHLTGWQLIKYVGAIHDLSAKTIKKNGAGLLERLSLDHAGCNQIRSYSKGMKQRLGLALAILPDPQLYILDEPMSGLDPLGRQMVKDIIIEEKNRGKSIFFSSHILNDIESLCDHIEIIRQGRIIYSGSARDFSPISGELESKFVALHRQLEKTEK